MRARALAHCGSSVSDGGRILSAIFRSSLGSTARHTSPMPPRPSRLSTTYRSKRSPGERVTRRSSWRRLVRRRSDERGQADLELAAHDGEEALQLRRRGLEAIAEEAQ